ncbi:hypothetical protein M0802_010901 [Mischocyttarus mexicanus]|nr:hypothetical protein M0802_010901 [Mischocyttarus mexicanus]
MRWWSRFPTLREGTSKATIGYATAPTGGSGGGGDVYDKRLSKPLTQVERFFVTVVLESVRLGFLCYNIIVSCKLGSRNIEPIDDSCGAKYAWIPEPPATWHTS